MATTPAEKPQAQAILLPAAPVLAVNTRQAALLSPEGEISLLSHVAAVAALGGRPALVCHAPYTRQRLEVETLPVFDVLELFAFVHPSRFCAPTPAGLAKALDLSLPQSFEDLPLTIMEAAQTLLSDLRLEPSRRTSPLEIARVMGQQGKGWNWAPYVFAALGHDYDPGIPPAPKAALAVWKHLPEWAEEAPPPPPAHHPVTGDESRNRLQRMMSAQSEERPEQKEYATAMTAAFTPREQENEPHILLAEAGTGVGKTAGYLAPASIWAEKNDGTVWISTFTKNLQRQIGQELNRLYPDPDVKDRKTAIRKGRENYLCLLNLEDAANTVTTARTPLAAIAAGLMARWAEVTNDGDMQGGDFPGWLPGLLGHAPTRGLANKRGECIYGACDHYHKCFVERAARKAKRASIVVANHALIMRYVADSGLDSDLPQRYVFDEGHHLFDAADSAFAAHLSARETADLRRWILGAEGGKRTRARGLKRRVEDLIAGDNEAESELQDILHTAHTLAGPGWSKRLKEGAPVGSTEEFLTLVYKQVLARNTNNSFGYSLETPVMPLIDGLSDSAQKLRGRLRDLQKPMSSLSARLRRMMNDNAATWDSDTRRRVESITISLGLKILLVTAWINMLATLEQKETPVEFVDWMEIERIEGRAVDVGLYRHWVDPMIPFSAAIKPHAHGIAITSATLRDRTGDDSEDWRTACERTGAQYLSSAPTIFNAPSPYDYATQTRIFIVNDVNKDDVDQVSAAYRALFTAAGGGGLGLFTAIQRLRAVQQRIIVPLEDVGIPLYAQHVDVMDNGTLVDVFREDTHACLLGTDAVRDGVDVPGDSLRLLIYDRVPWPRPTLLHKARQEKFGRQRFDDMTIRLKLRQAYGRLIRRATDRGVFVMLEGRLPSRLLTAFPDGTPVERIGLAEAIEKTKVFLSLSPRPSNSGA